MVGDRVLLFNSRLKIFLGMLKPLGWDLLPSPKFFPYGIVELSQPDGPNFKVNGHRVKHYFRGDIPSKVRILQESHEKSKKPDKNEHETERVHKSRVSQYVIPDVKGNATLAILTSMIGCDKWHAIQRMELILGSKANIEGTGLEISDAPQGPRSFIMDDKLTMDELIDPPAYP
ncbi:hypothetical protein Tco_0727819 [Tanacetum coccineum]|uniref:Uncharacterized protein n=1 Tax=Tanacetum coccineum TaxID=301880 RepID=A0ABQ4YJG7_9ASTR